MCHVPSWITLNKKVLFITDKDARRHGMRLDNATGHTGIRDVFGQSAARGMQGEGLHGKTPKIVREAIESGAMNRIISAGVVRITGGKWSIPCTSIGEGLEISGKSTVTFPNLKKVNSFMVVKRGATVNAPNLTFVHDRRITVGGKLNAPKFKGEIVKA